MYRLDKPRKVDLETTLYVDVHEDAESGQARFVLDEPDTGLELEVTLGSLPPTFIELRLRVKGHEAMVVTQEGAETFRIVDEGPARLSLVGSFRSGDARGQVEIIVRPSLGVKWSTLVAQR